MMKNNDDLRCAVAQRKQTALEKKARRKRHKRKPSKDPNHPDWVNLNSIFNFKQKDEMANKRKLVRYKRFQDRREAGPSSEVIQLEASRSNHTEVDVDSAILSMPTTKEAEFLTDFTGNHYANLANENAKLLKRSRDAGYHAGLQNKGVLSTLLKFCILDWQPATKSSLSFEFQLLMVLMRLRLGLMVKDLSHRFGVHFTTASQLINDWIDGLYRLCSLFNAWPFKRNIRRNRSRAFKNSTFQDTRGIIDCSEIFTEAIKSKHMRSNLFLIQNTQYCQIVGSFYSIWCGVVYLASMGWKNH
ncbi:hypothetical protein JTE90_024392 [Oedothorax gibbosus]|uniref:Transposase Helix-turn-helix domain-containing protein n=1 Tax=Oedothorax gibbosus TaxID=931172 RepID=A0AAV6TSN8_9ARAC|nr:hypothetical protein JTE90_024392 [Oedothorax gibbosus]